MADCSRVRPRARELNGQDVITSGSVALTKSVDNDAVLMEHVFSSEGENTSMLKQTLQPKLEIRLEAAYDRISGGPRRTYRWTPSSPRVGKKVAWQRGAG